MTYRTGANLNFHTLSQPGSRQIALNDFTPQQARRLIRERLGTDQLPLLLEQRLGLRDRQGRESAVNPLFLEESLQLMLSLQVVELDKNKYGDGRLRINEVELAKMQVSDTIYTLLLSRLDQLPAAERGLLQTASVIGREFDLTTLVAISPGLSRETAVELLNTLVQTDLVQQLSAGLAPIYLFQHNLVHEVVYQSLTYARRQTLHATIAELIIRQSGELLPTQYPVLAYHFSQTNQHLDGLKYALAAANDAETTHNYRGAAEFFKQAANHLEALGEKAAWETAVSVCVARARLLLRLGQFGQASLMVAEAMKLCLDHNAIEKTLGLYNLTAEIRLRQARYTEVPGLTNKVINSLLADTPPVQQGQAYLLWGQALAALGDWAAAQRKLSHAETILLTDPQPRLTAPLFMALADVQTQRQLDDTALFPLETALSLLADETDPLLWGQVQLTLSQVLLRLGRADAALTAAETAVSRLRAAGTNLLAHGLTHRAAVYIYLGQFEAALGDLQMAGELFDGMDDVAGQLKLYLLWGVEYHGRQGDWRQARRRLVRVGQLLTAQPKDDGMVMQEGIRLWLGMGLVALHSARWDQARSLLQKVLTAVASRQFVWWQPAAYYTWGQLLLATAGEGVARQSALVEAFRSFQKGFQAVQTGGCPDELPLLLLQMGLTAVELGDTRGWDYLETAVEAARQRARHTDRQQVQQQARLALGHAPDPHLRQLGQSLMRQSEA